MHFRDDLRMPMPQRMHAARGAAIQQPPAAINVPDMRAIAPAEHELYPLFALALRNRPPGPALIGIENRADFLHRNRPRR